MEILFENPEYLWLIAGIPLLIATHLISLRYLKRRAFLFANFSIVSRALGDVQTLSMNTLPVILRVIVFILLTLGISGIQIKEDAIRADSDFVFVLDTSSSMASVDYPPTRLQAVSSSLNSFVDSLGSVEADIGIVTFAGVAKPVLNPTSDKATLKSALSSTQVSNTGGTAIGDALILASNMLLNSERGKKLVLITDGQSNVGASPLDAVKVASDEGISVTSIGLVSNPVVKYENLSLVGKLDEETLKTISTLTGGEYYLVDSPAGLSEALSSLATYSRAPSSIDLSPIFLLLGLGILIVEWFVVNTKYRTLP